MSRPLSCSQALLNDIEPRDPSTWSDAFDKVLKDVLEQCRPGYVEIPTDAIHYKVSAEGLKKLLVSRCVYAACVAARCLTGMHVNMDVP